MSEAPERIWATGDSFNGSWTSREIPPQWGAGTVEYIRTDLALPAVQPDDDLVGHMTKLIAAGLDRIEQLTAERDRLREALEAMRSLAPKVMKALMYQNRDGLLLADEVHKADDIARAALKGETP